MTTHVVPPASLSLPRRGWTMAWPEGTLEMPTGASAVVRTARQPLRERSVDETIVDRARAHAATMPRHSAFTFQGWGTEAVTWDFETLDRRARAFAATLEA